MFTLIIDSAIPIIFSGCHITNIIYEKMFLKRTIVNIAKNAIFLVSTRLVVPWTRTTLINSEHVPNSSPICVLRIMHHCYFQLVSNSWRCITALSCNLFTTPLWSSIHVVITSMPLQSNIAHQEVVSIYLDLMSSAWECESFTFF